ncbi:MAG: hypothetical protein VX335_05235 [Pseudomonadota bacterium]|nr:hypothetical protein [Pseudomonadota bacterium]
MKITSFLDRGALSSLGYPITLMIFAAYSTAAYFAITGITYGLVLLMPSVLMLPTYQSYFGLLGIAGLAVAIESTLSRANVVTGVTSGIQSFVFFMAPFFIAIACGQSAYIPATFLNLSAVNIAVLSSCCLTFLFLAGVSSVVFSVFNSVTTKAPAFNSVRTKAPNVVQMGHEATSLLPNFTYNIKSNDAFFNNNSGLNNFDTFENNNNFGNSL